MTIQKKFAATKLPPRVLQTGLLADLGHRRKNLVKSENEIGFPAPPFTAIWIIAPYVGVPNAVMSSLAITHLCLVRKNRNAVITKNQVIVAVYFDGPVACVAVDLKVRAKLNLARAFCCDL